MQAGNVLLDASVYSTKAYFEEFIYRQLNVLAIPKVALLKVNLRKVFLFVLDMVHGVLVYEQLLQCRLRTTKYIQCYVM